MGSRSLKLKAVCNSTPIIALSKIGALRFLNIFNELIIPEAVIKEVEIGGFPKEMNSIDYEVKRCMKSDSKFDKLDIGEAKGLSIIKDLDEGHIFLTDDLDARRKGNEEGVEVHGSVGIIVLAFSHNEININEAIDLIRDIQKKTDLFIADEIVETGIKELKNRSD